MDDVESLSGRIDVAIKNLTPGYFALVMATGIVSVGMYSAGQMLISNLLLLIAVVAYPLLVVLNIIRFVKYRDAVASDMADPARAFGFFTFVAATNVLGSRLGVEGRFGTASVLLIVASLAWVVLGYTVPWTAVLGRTERPMLQTANGTWFIWVVASQSVAVVAATLELEFVEQRRVLALVAVFSWSVGVFLYAAAGIFVSARMMLYEFKPTDLTPPYWVSMGATAITVVAGARIVGMADAPMVNATRGLIAGASVLFWSFGTWLIPPLIAAGLWRHVVHKVPMRYEATLWSIIFPLGMYGVGSRYLGDVDHLPIVHSIGVGQGWIALTAWTLTFIAMLRHIWLTVFATPRVPSEQEAPQP